METELQQKSSQRIISTVAQWYTIGVVFYMIGLMDYSACSNITGNSACNNYRQFMLTNLTVLSMLEFIPTELNTRFLAPLKIFIHFVFTICHIAFLSISMNPDSKCPAEISAGCDAQAFKGYNILHYYSLIYLGCLAVVVGIVVILSLISCCADGVVNADFSFLSDTSNVFNFLNKTNANQSTNRSNLTQVRITSN